RSPLFPYTTLFRSTIIALPGTELNDMATSSQRYRAVIAGLTALVLLGGPAVASADPGPKIAVAFASSAEELPREAIRAAIATELDVAITDDVHAADGVLVVALADDGQITVSFRPRGPITEV